MSMKILQVLFHATATGSFVLLLLCLFAPLADRYLTKTWQYRALLVPSLLFLGVGGFIPKSLAPTVPMATVALPPTMVATQAPLPPPPDAPVFSVLPFADPASLLIWLWFSIAVVLFVGRLANYLQLRRSLIKSGVFITQPSGSATPVLRTSLVSTPMAAGLFHPAIFLPEVAFSAEETQMILSHETAHIRRGDLWLKALSLVCLSIHWFNPFAYLLVRRMDSLCEESCDEYVTANMTTAQRKIYGNTILRVLSYRNHVKCVLCAPMSSGAKEVKRRLHRIMTFKTISKRKLFLSLVLLLVVAALGLLCAWSLTPQDSKQLPETQTKNTLSQNVPPPAADNSSLVGIVPQSQDLVKEETYEEAIPFEQELQYSDEFFSDYRAILVPGKEGLKRITARRTYRDGEVIFTEILSEEVLVSPITEKQMVGTLTSEPTATDEVLLNAFVWPVDGGYLSAGFNSYPGHTGLDIAAKAGTPVLAARGGTVMYVDEHSVWPYGKRIDINHGDGWITRYAQLNSINVAEGDKVVQGQQIGGVGRTGNATGNHLHFEIRYQDGSLDPANYIGTKAPE